ncbi:nuclease-related domain-containing protein [Evansella tamaricis]|uniref:NERD domain-containing protein n=1 Tax=Evansella tamaricis TaxID=2069301 RepID=A0ABS6J9E8_9BACI|nr:nuclease-related domain-containing protein [Evansella tamaricis]MBU9710308.1 NERD domain-containing protein [Evansella tamaricis]
MVTIIKPRSKPLELIMMEYLSYRMEFSQSQKRHLYRLNSGYEGEVRLDQWYDNCPDHWLVLNDLWLKNSTESYFQIDSLLITPRTAFVLDAKNNYGEHHLLDDRWYRCSDSKEWTTNPLTQQKRCETSFRQILQNSGTSFPIVSKLVFVNQEFTLYNTPQGLPLLLPTQIKSFFENMKMNDPGPAKPTQNQIKLANYICTVHMDKSPYSNLPGYDFEGLKKGLLCENCKSFLAPPVESCRSIVCHRCGHNEEVKSCILRAIEELVLLFPDEELTTDRVYQWCKVINCKRRISRLLGEKLKRVGYGYTACYLF